MTKISCCLFDLDGTLADSIPLIVDSFRYAVKQHTDLRPTDEEFIAGIGIPLREQLGTFCHDAETLDAMGKTYAEYYIAHHDEAVGLFDGVSELIRELADRKYRLGIITSKSEIGAIRTLKRMGMLHAFEHVVCAEHTELNKPHPAPVLHAMSLFGSTPEQSVFVGDSPHDIESGNRAGVRTLAVRWTAFPLPTMESSFPSSWIETPMKMLDWLGEHG